MTDNEEEHKRFEDMNLKKSVLRGIFSYGFEEPSPIQKRAIPKIISGKDIIAQAQSGTGKTATFSISVLQNINEDNKELQAIIMSPTRELSEQIYTVISNLAKYTKYKIALLLGGKSRNEQIDILKNGVQCVICTPGRINDLIQNQYINTEYVKCLVLDEADELLADAFVDQIRSVVQYLPTRTQICLFSATMPEVCQRMADNFLDDPIRIIVKKEQLTLEGISQYYISTNNDKMKYDAITDLYESIIINQLIIYCNTKQRVMYLADTLKKDGYGCSCIHSDLTTTERLDTMSRFRKGDTRVLISTDLLSRGIDIQQVSLVINYDIPRNIECYIHRIGRSGRYGRKGIALNFLSKYDVGNLNDIEKFYNTQIQELPIDVEGVFNQTK